MAVVWQSDCDVFVELRQNLERVWSIYRAKAKPWPTKLKKW